MQPGCKPFNDRYYVVHNTNKKILRKELHQLVDIWVFTLFHQSQYGTPIFIISKDEGNVINMNHQIVRKPHRLLIIGDTIQQLQGFQYDTSLNLNMRYYTIEIYPESRNLQLSLLNLVYSVKLILWNSLQIQIKHIFVPQELGLRNNSE